MLLAISVRLLVRVPVVQTWLAQKVTGYLASELNTRIEVGFVDIRLFSSLVLKDLYVEDLQKDTLLFAPVLEAGISSFDWDKRKIVIRSIVLDHARIGVKRYREPREYSLDFLISYFSGDTQDTSASRPWQVKVENITLVSNTFSYRDEKYSDTTRCVDFEDLLLRDLNIHLRNLEPKGDTLGFDIEKISFREKSGFIAKGFEASVLIAPGSMQFSDLHISTPFSELHSQLKFNFESIDDFQEFITKVQWEGDFAESVISSNDLCFFASELFDANRKVAFHGKVRGTVDRFKARDVEIRYSPTTFFKGSVNMTGLPDFDETYMEIGVDELSMRRSDLLTLPVTPFDSGRTLNVPANIGELGTVRFQGKFNGFYNDFVAYGNISTALGYASTDLNLKISPQDKNTQYRGSLKLFDFDMGRFWDAEPELGRVTLDTKLKGKGFELKNINSELEGKISRLDLMGYSYTGLIVSGKLSKKLFNGSLNVTDPNLKLDFSGNIDFNGALPALNFTAFVQNAYLHKLNLIKRDTSAHFSGALDINLVGSNIENVQGIIEAMDFKYSERGKDVVASRIYIESVTGKQRELKLRSDFADAQMIGNYTLGKLGSSLRWVLSTYIPAIHTKVQIPANQEITFRIQTKETKPVTDMFLPWLKIAPATLAEGSVNTNQQKINLHFQSGYVETGGVKFRGIAIDGNTINENLVFHSTMRELIVNDSIDIQNLIISGKSSEDSAAFEVRLTGLDPERSKADFGIQAGFPSPGVASLHLNPRIMMLNGVNWSLDTNNRIDFDSSGITINSLFLRSGDQLLHLDGRAGKDTSAHMQVVFRNFRADQLNPVLMQYEVQLGGTVNGEAVVTALTGKPYFESDLQIDSLRWYNDTLGNAVLHTRYNSDAGEVAVNGTVTRGGDKNIQLNGKYVLDKAGDKLDFDIKVQKTYLSTFSQYLEGVFSNVSGIISADLKLKGPVKNPALTGKAIIQKGMVTVDYLKTSYSFSTEVDLDEDAITCKNVTLNDQKGNQGTMSASIYHNHLRDFYLDIDIRARNMQVLNTQLTDNDIFYGTAYASGNVSISGFLDNLSFTLGLKSERNTRINIPLSNPSEVSQSTFITFIKHDSTGVLKDSLSGPDFSGITLNMDFEITPEATIALIFDDKIGDVIEGSGSGNITMSVSPSEDFRMYGNFEIEEGRYLFTMQNVINKPFIISPGGYIRWNGNPYDADIKIDAVYKLKTGLYDLFQDSTFRKLVPVELELHLKDKLFNPTIAFDINVQNVDPTVENQVKRLINTEEEKYRQAMALLVMRRFTSPSEFSNRAPVNSGGVVGANAYELLSNQLSNWVNQISNQVNFGVNYRPGDALTSEELEVALSTTILNDRVTIDGNVGYANTTTTGNQNTSNLVGDFNVEVKANKDGRIRLKAFNRSNNNSLINNVNSQYTQGVGIFYREEFNSLGELWRKYTSMFRKKDEPAETGSK